MFFENNITQNVVVSFVLFASSTAAKVLVEGVDSFNLLFSISSLRPPLGGGDEKNVNGQPEQSRIEIKVPLWFPSGRFPELFNVHVKCDQQLVK